jgi:hypothetical protein
MNDNISPLAQSLLELLKIKKTLTINEILEWSKSKNINKLVLSTIIGELDEKGLIAQSGRWAQSEPLFPLPERIEIKEVEEERKEEKLEERKEEIKIEKSQLQYIEKVKEYIARYYSVGELRLRLDFSDKIKEMDPILKKLGEEGLIVWDKELGTITATDKLIDGYKKQKKFIDYFKE